MFTFLRQMKFYFPFFQQQQPLKKDLLCSLSTKQLIYSMTFLHFSTGAGASATHSRRFMTAMTFTNEMYEKSFFLLFSLFFCCSDELKKKSSLEDIYEEKSMHRRWQKASHLSNLAMCNSNSAKTGFMAAVESTAYKYYHPSLCRPIAGETNFGAKRKRKREGRESIAHQRSFLSHSASRVHL